jgi:hypothetical protein
VTANAADPAPTMPANPPQVAANPDIPYSYARLPGPKASGSNWIPSPYSSATTPNSGAGTAGGYYSGKAYVPKPN